MRTFAGLALWVHFGIGTTVALGGPALPGIRSTFGLSLAAVGWLFPAMSLGYLGGVLGSGILVERSGRRIVVVWGSGLLATGLALLAVAPAWPVALLAGVVAGWGFAGVDVGLSAALSDAVPEPRAKARALNVVHSFFAVGTLTAPVLWAWALEHGATWRHAHGVVALLMAVSVPLAIKASFPTRHQRSPLDRRVVQTVLADRPLRWLGLILALYVGLEIGIGGWLTTYLGEVFGSTPAAGARATALYWAGLLVGRLIASTLAGPWGTRRLLLVSVAAALATLCAGLVAPTAPITMAAYALAGVSIASIWPTVLAIALARHPQHAGPTTALLLSGASLGGLTLPGLMGVAGQAWGPRGIMALVVLTAAAMLAATYSALPREATPGVRRT